ncbi:MAG: hypothetical protein FD162_2417 [Rhodobacteraceae bacterium]|uniref:DUF2927 domain-containing protein n=1 Tax=Cypionkella sp. TaxID=2811411 RepID=UPI0013253154|nr:DUF2927 domain-containing protein [Cypionkella sp.]KAF0172320.1 MAG: hypothetical protein FD162_2417 [Paracoccaceae bacterium]MDO8327483.1 DUF2927 domain-containing protein [Cypionkella sp.]
MTLVQPKTSARKLGLLVLVALMGCASAPVPGVVPVPRPSAPVEWPKPAPVESAASAAARAYYAQVQQALLSQGLLRTDGGGADTPLSDRLLAQNFIRIALYDEYARGTAGSVQRQTASELRRWQAPVRVGLHFGASVPAEKRGTDTARVASYLQRLAAATGHPIRLDDSNPNFQLYIVNEDERQALGPQLRAALPELTNADVAGITNLARSTYCIVYAQSQGNSGVYNGAFAVIRAEHPDLLRLSCIHEEIAQGLGLPNDSPQARPSIFNDDEEFALLTRQDELMLKMLYSPELRPGMTEAEARPIVETLASRLLGSES